MLKQSFGMENVIEKEVKRMAKPKEKKEVEKEYKSPILYLHKSEKGKHLYAFNIEARGKEGGEMVLGNNIESLILNVSDVTAVLEGEMKWAKVSVVLKEDGE